MGVHGWVMVDPNNPIRIVYGKLQSQHYSGGGGFISSEDYDSNLEVVPQDGSVLGPTNQGGIIECEIHVARNVPGTPNLDPIFNPLVGKDVVLSGAFVEDKDHDYKTEIHPIDWLAGDLGSDGVRTHVRLCVFSDDWSFIPAQPQAPFYAGTDRIGDFGGPFPYPPGPQPYIIIHKPEDYVYTPTYIVQEDPVSGYQSAELGVFYEAENEATYFKAYVHSGTPDNDQGLYVADITYYWRSPRPSFQALDSNNILVLKHNGHLWLEHAPFGQTIPPRHDQVDTNVLAFQALNTKTVFVLDRAGNLRLDLAPGGFAEPGFAFPVDTNVLAFQAVDADTVFVLGKDGKLWREHGPFGQSIPPPRDPVDSNVLVFQALDSDDVLVLDSDGILWREGTPFGNAPPLKIDKNVFAFQGNRINTDVFVLTSDTDLWQDVPPSGNILLPPHLVSGNVQAFQIGPLEFAWVLKTDASLWLVKGPFGQANPPPPQPIDTNVRAFQILDLRTIVVLDTDGRLWLKHAPFGTPSSPHVLIDRNVRVNEPVGLIAQVV